MIANWQEKKKQLYAGDERNNVVRRITLMNVGIDNITMQDAMNFITDCVEKRKKEYIVTPNVDHVVKLQNNEQFRKAYLEAGLVAVDGTPIVWVSKWCGKPLKEKITGPKLTEKTIELASTKNFSVFFLGGKEGVGDLAAKRMLEKYPGFRYVGAYSPKFGFEKDKEEIDKIISVINQAKPDILIVGMGSPKTEIFLNNIYELIEANVSLSVGAAIDFCAGTVKRCPEWVNKIGFEWLYRFIKEPSRMFKRYFVDDFSFLFLAIKEKRKWGK